VNFGLQPSRTLSEVARPEIYGEAATITVDHEVGALPIIDVMAGFRVSGSLGIGVGFSRLGDSDSPAVSALVPHPFAFDQPRAATATADDLAHSETAVHIALLWMSPITEDFELTTMVGPSFYTVKQDVVGGLGLSEGAGFSTVTINSVTTSSESESGVGFIAGLDGTYLVTPTIGVGVFARFSRASVDIPVAGGGTMETTAGGFQVGAGLRFRF
jgi:hypothetical protein